MAPTSPLNVSFFELLLNQCAAECAAHSKKKREKNDFIIFCHPSWTKTWCCQPQLLQECFLKCKNPPRSSYELPVHQSEVVKARQADDWISMLLHRRCCPQIAKTAHHRVYSASEELRLIGSHQQRNIPKWQHLISSFCPGASLALSLPLCLVSPSHFSEHHYLIIPTPQLANKHTVTRMNKPAEMCSVVLLWIFSWHICPPSLLGLPGHILLPQLSRTHLPHLPISLLLVRPTSHPWQQLQL